MGGLAAPPLSIARAVDASSARGDRVASTEAPSTYRLGETEIAATATESITCSTFGELIRATTEQRRPCLVALVRAEGSTKPDAYWGESLNVWFGTKKTNPLTNTPISPPNATFYAAYHPAQDRLHALGSSAEYHAVMAPAFSPQTPEDHRARLLHRVYTAQFGNGVKGEAARLYLSALFDSLSRAPSLAPKAPKKVVRPSADASAALAAQISLAFGAKAEQALVSWTENIRPEQPSEVSLAGAMEHAVVDRQSPALQVLLASRFGDKKAGAALTPNHLGFAMHHGDLEAVEAVLGAPGRSFDVNEPIREDGFTFLMFAASLSDLDLVDCLLNSGADPRRVDGEGRSVFDWVPAERRDIIRHLHKARDPAEQRDVVPGGDRARDQGSGRARRTKRPT